MKEKIKTIFMTDDVFVGDENKYHYFYRIYNNITSKEYYGIHSTQNLNDSYSGSGTLIKKSIKKYGIISHCKCILKFFKSRKECSEYEKQIITDDYLYENKMTYNIICGGENGHSIPESVRLKISESEKGKKVSIESRIKNSISNKGRSVWNKGLCGKYNPQFGRKRTETTKKNISNGLKRHYECHEGTFKGHHHSDISKKKISEKRIGIKFTEEHKKKLSNAKIGTHRSEETKEKIRIFVKNNPRGAVQPKSIFCITLNVNFKSVKDAWTELSNTYDLPSYSNFAKKVKDGSEICNLKFEYK